MTQRRFSTFQLNRVSHHTSQLISFQFQPGIEAVHHLDIPSLFAALKRALNCSLILYPFDQFLLPSGIVLTPTKVFPPSATSTLPRLYLTTCGANPLLYQNLSYRISLSGKCRVRCSDINTGARSSSSLSMLCCPLKNPYRHGFIYLLLCRSCHTVSAGLPWGS